MFCTQSNVRISYDQKLLGWKLWWHSQALYKNSNTTLCNLFFSKILSCLTFCSPHGWRKHWANLHLTLESPVGMWYGAVKWYGFVTGVFTHPPKAPCCHKLGTLGGGYPVYGPQIWSFTRKLLFSSKTLFKVTDYVGFNHCEYLRDHSLSDF